ncbi:MAG: hypothetical protein KC620_01545 [Myxococcales bacterium]|nr:hypothetical protein [Myxococcales bacterium]
MQLRTLLLNVRPDPAARAAREAALRRRVLAESPNLRRPDFARLTPADLTYVFQRYDAEVFGGALQTTLASPRGGPLDLRVSARMTRAGGLTRRGLRRTFGKVEQRFEISLSAPLLFGTFCDDPRPITVVGRLCNDRLDALLRIFEHELLHLCEYLVFGESNCNASRFAQLAHDLFGHTEATHRLITPRERAHLDHGIGVGDVVDFQFEGQRLRGRVNRITKRATVLVESTRGRRYSDGGCYEKYYVPLEALSRATPGS